MADYTVPERQHVVLVTSDLQRDFLEPNSPLTRCSAGRCIGQCATVVSAFRRAGLPIYHSVRFFLPDGSNVERSRRQAVEEGMRVLMPGTSGAELVDGIAPDGHKRLNALKLLEGDAQELGPNEWAFCKPRWGAFYSTRLDEYVRKANATTVVVIGSDFECGVRPTVYEACARDYRVIVVPDAAGCQVDDIALNQLGRLGVYLIGADALSLWLANPRSEQGAA